MTYTLNIDQPFARGREGLVSVKVTKDRPGHVRPHAGEGDRIAEMRLLSGEDGSVRIFLDPPDGRAAAVFRPTGFMERISRALEESPGLSKNAVRAAVKGKNDAKDLALELLVTEGYVERTQDGQSHRHDVVRPFREEADEDHRAPAPESRPNRAPARSEDNRVPVPLPVGGHGAGHGEEGPPPDHDYAPLASAEVEADLQCLIDKGKAPA